MDYRLCFTRQAAEDWETLRKQGTPSLEVRARQLLEILRSNPFSSYPPYKKLNGALHGLYARRLSLKHRLVYQVIEEEKAVKVLSMWTHYGD
jgi:toxin YoeB